VSVQLLEFNRRILLQELVNGEEAAPDPYIDLVLVDADLNALAAELVDALGLAHEHYL